MSENELIIIIVSSVSKVPPQDLQKNNHQLF